MIATPRQIREGIRDNLKAIKGLQVNAYPISNPTPPSCYVASGPTQYDLTMGRGLDKPQFIVVVFVALNHDLGAQELLDEFAQPQGARSVKAAVETDKTLGGIVGGLRVTEFSGTRSYTFDTLTTGTQRPPVIGGEFTVEVFAGR